MKKHTIGMSVHGFNHVDEELELIEAFKLAMAYGAIAFQPKDSTLTEWTADNDNGTVAVIKEAKQ